MLVAIFRLILTYPMVTCMRGKHFHQSAGLTGMYLLGQAVRQLFLSELSNSKPLDKCIQIKNMSNFTAYFQNNFYNM